MKFVILLGLLALVTACVLGESPDNQQVQDPTSKKEKRTAHTYGLHSGGLSFGGQQGAAGLSYAPLVTGLSLGHLPSLGFSSNFGHGGFSLGGAGLGHALLLPGGHGLGGLSFGGHGLGQPVLLQSGHGLPSYGLGAVSGGHGAAAVASKLGPVTFGLGTGGSASTFGHDGASLSYSSPSIASLGTYNSPITLGHSASATYSPPAPTHEPSSYSAPSSSYSYSYPSQSSSNSPYVYSPGGSSYSSAAGSGHASTAASYSPGGFVGISGPYSKRNTQ